MAHDLRADFNELLFQALSEGTLGAMLLSGRHQVLHSGELNA